MLISILIPCYNEAKIIVDSYQELKRYLNLLNFPYEIIFCNDGSIDNTRYLLEEIAMQDKNVKTISYQPNRGAGFAFRQMCKISYGDILIHMDADLAMKPDVTIPLFIRELENVDIVIGSRYAKIKPDFPLRRLIPSKMILSLNNILFNCNFKDTNSGFFAIRRKVLEKIHLYSNDFGIYIELFVKAKRAGFSIKETPIKFVHMMEFREASILKHGPRILLDIFKLRLIK